MVLEWVKPWRKEQPRFRKDFWLDAFYMFFNFFLFSLIIYNAASDVVVAMFQHLSESLTGIDLIALNPMRTWPLWAILLTGFIIRDFIQWWVHRLLHWSDTLWEFHKVHHSVEVMGFAAHLRYHWMENIVYRTIEYLPLAMLGIGLYDFFIIHIFTIVVGHYNHSNISISSRVTGGILGLFISILMVSNSLDIHLLEGSGMAIKSLVVLIGILVGVYLFAPFMKIIFNSPEMHIWHHSYQLPRDMKYGINFGITLAVWDYIFRMAHLPSSGRDIKLGFPGLTSFPHTFSRQIMYGFNRNQVNSAPRIEHVKNATTDDGHRDS